MALEPDEGWINLVGWIYPTWGRICSTWPGCQGSRPNDDQIYPAGRICLTWTGHQGSRTNENVQLGQIYPTKRTQQRIKRFRMGLSTPIFFNNSVVSLLIVWYAYDSKINTNSFLSWAHQLFSLSFFH
jgi:hypothetical protein